MHQKAQHHGGHINQHQADQNFIRIAFVFEPSHQSRPGHATRHTRQQNHHHDPAPGAGIGLQGHATGGNRTDDELALGTNIPNIGAKTN